MYHHVSPELVPGFRKYTVTPQAFAAQMRWLATRGYTSVDLDALLAARSGGDALPPRPVVITFDDGFQDCVRYAVPVLQSHGFTAVFYLVAGLVGETSRWLQPGPAGNLALMDWPAARQLEAMGFRCGAHTMTHPRLVDLSRSACGEELRDSRHLLEDHLGHDVRHLAYPFGSLDDGVRALAAEAGYRSAASVRIGLSPPDDDPLILYRVPINGQDALVDFVCRLYTAHTVGEHVRRFAGAIRRRWGPIEKERPA